jgi:glycosyltransferase involved in cell wall biosynthesis
MKVLHFITRFNAGGTSSFLHNLLKAQEEPWEHLVVFGKTNYPEFEDVRILDLPHIRLRSAEKSFNPFLATKTFFEIRRIIRSEQPDVVNTHTSHAGLLARLAVRSISKTNRPIAIHTIHGHLLYGYFSSFEQKIYVVVERSLSFITDGFIVPGSIMYQELKKSKIISATKPTVVVNPPIEIQSPFQVKNITEKSNRRLKIGWMGRITKIKRVDRILELALVTPELDFFLAGSVQGQELGAIPKNLKIFPWSDPIEFWKDLDVAILTSENEAQPLMLLEAASFGIPAVTTAVGSTQDAVINQETGIALPWNLNVFRNALLKLRDDPIFLEDLGKNAFNRVNRDYSPKTVIHAHQVFYCQLLRKRPYSI